MNENFTIDKSGVKTVEILGAAFIADEDSIFGELNLGYIERELAWYKSMSLSVDDIPGGTPAIWKNVADENGYVNSNYGFLIWSETNGRQYERVLKTLQNDPNSRRAVMIYTRPTMHVDFNNKGMSDFVCTNTVTYLIRNGKLYSIVNMRSNDAIFGYKNDYAWQQYVLEKLALELNVKVGTITWQVASLHIYERHFFLVDNFIKNKTITVKKEDYKTLYPDSPWSA